MLARFFQKSEPISFVSLLVLLFFHTNYYRYYIENIDFNFSSSLESFGVFIFFGVLLLLIDFIIYKNHLTAVNYYSLFIFVSLLGLFPEVLNFSKISFANLFILLSIRRLYSLRTQKEILLKLFDSGFYIGISFLLYPISVVFLLLIYVSYFNYIRVFNKSLLLPVLGFITPIFLGFTYFFLTDNIASFKTLTELNINFNKSKFSDLHFLIPLIIIIAFVVFALIKNVGIRQNLDIEGKKSFQLVFINFILALVLVLINNLQIEQSIQFAFLPIVVLLGNFLFFTKRNWLKELLFYLLLLFSLQQFLW